MNVYLPNKRLPNTYQEVEYIQSSGTQYINTGIVPNYQTRMKIGVANTVTPYQTFLPFAGCGTTKKSGESYAHQYYVAVGDNGSGTITYRSCISGTNQVYSASVNCDLNVYHEFDVQSGSQKIDGVQFATDTIGSSDSFHSLNIMLFGRNVEWNNPTYAPTACRIYFCELYSNGTLVRNFVPCYRKSDSVIGLYDLVNNQFYTNSGTGTFSKGNDVTMAVLKNAYIGEVWTPGSNTLAYYPLTSSTTVNDQSGNSRNLTNTGSVTFGTYKGVNCAYFSGSNFLKYSLSYDKRAVTFSGWGYYIRKNVYNEGFVRWGPNFGAWIDHGSNRLNFGGISGPILTSDSNWGHIVTTYDGGTTAKLYYNGVLQGTNASISPQTGGGLAIGNANIDSTTDYWEGGISEVIVENKVRTAQEIADYYNQTKSKYGL